MPSPFHNTTPASELLELYDSSGSRFKSGPEERAVAQQLLARAANNGTVTPEGLKRVLAEELLQDANGHSDIALNLLNLSRLMVDKTNR